MKDSFGGFGFVRAGLEPDKRLAGSGRVYCPCMVQWPPRYPLSVTRPEGPRARAGGQSRRRWARLGPSVAEHAPRARCRRAVTGHGFTHPRPDVLRSSLCVSVGNSAQQACSVLKGFLYNSDLFILLILPFSVHPAYTRSCQASNGTQNKPILF